ncbi:aquaporin [Streptomyces sp. NPDC007157]|uniref:MIP/aquaporin family protein n=1 Tax=Streptomyces sp. NPDC007157 TaxID=3154681 RepID=UPI00340A0449
MRSSPPLTRSPSLRQAGDEFVLTTVLLFVTVTGVRWLRDPGATLYIADLNTALAVDGAFSGAVVTGLILSPLGRRSGGHMNPAVTAALWLMNVIPGRSVMPYVLAQLTGSVAGTALARLVWGPAVSHAAVADAVIRPAGGWRAGDVFLAEAGAMMALVLIVGVAMAHPRRAPLVPWVIGSGVALVIALLGPRSGGSVNPARQLGPAVFSHQTTDLWIYLTVPVLGAVIGAALCHVFIRRFHSSRQDPARRPTEPPSAQLPAISK